MKRTLAPFFFAAAVASLLNCGGGREESFTTDGDTKVMAGISGIWMGSTPDGKTYTVTLCENAAATKADNRVGCDALHIVRGNGHGTTEDTQEPSGGCGGCIFSYPAFVNGTIEGDDIGETTIHGQFDLGDSDDKGLGFPYEALLQSDRQTYGVDSTSAVSLYGEMKQPGVIDIDQLSYFARDYPSGQAPEDAAAPPTPTDGDAAVYYDNNAQITTPAFELHRIGDAACPSN